MSFPPALEKVLSQTVQLYSLVVPRGGEEWRAGPAPPAL